MDTLLESLEELLDAEGNPNYEVEYNVCHGPYPTDDPTLTVLLSRAGCLLSSWVSMGLMLSTSSLRTNKYGSHHQFRK